MLSYVTDSLQSLAQTIRSHNQAWMLLLSFVRGSAVKTERLGSRTEDTGDDFTEFSITPSPYPRQYSEDRSRCHVATQCGQHDVQWRSVRRREKSFRWHSLCGNRKKMAANINVSERNTLPVLPQYK